MEENKGDENVDKKGITISSPDSVDALISTVSTQITVSDVPSTSGYRPGNSPSSSTQSKSKSLLASISDGPTSELSSDVATPVTKSQSQSTDTAYAGTRFVVKRMDSYELQSSPSKDEKSPQSPKSVKFEKAGPSKGKSPAKSPGGLSKSVTTSVLTMLDDLEAPKKLFSPKSEDSFSFKAIELPTITRIGSSSSESDDEDFFAGVDKIADRLNKPLLTSLKTIDVRSPDGILSTVSVEEIPDTPGAVSSEGTSTLNADRACGNCLLNSTFCYVAIVVGVIIIISIVALILHFAGYFNSVDVTVYTTTQFPLTTSSLYDTSELPFTTQLSEIPETTTNALPTTYDPATDAQDFNDPTTTTTDTFTTTDTTFIEST